MTDAIMTYDEAIAYLTPAAGNNGTILLQAPKVRAALSAVLPDILARDGWMPIATAPKDGTKVLLSFAPPFSDNSETGTVTGMWISENWWLSSIWASSGAHKQPTHWMPLPAPPAVEQKP